MLKKKQNRVRILDSQAYSSPEFGRMSPKLSREPKSTRRARREEQVQQKLKKKGSRQLDSSLDQVKQINIDLEHVSRDISFMDNRDTDIAPTAKVSVLGNKIGMQPHYGRAQPPQYFSFKADSPTAAQEQQRQLEELKPMEHHLQKFIKDRLRNQTIQKIRNSFQKKATSEKAANPFHRGKTPSGYEFNSFDSRPHESSSGFQTLQDQKLNPITLPSSSVVSLNPQLREGQPKNLLSQKQLVSSSHKGPLRKLAKEQSRENSSRNMLIQDRSQIDSDQSYEVSKRIKNRGSQDSGALHCEVGFQKRRSSGFSKPTLPISHSASNLAQPLPRTTTIQQQPQRLVSGTHVPSYSNLYMGPNQQLQERTTSRSGFLQRQARVHVQQPLGKAAVYVIKPSGNPFVNQPQSRFQNISGTNQAQCAGSHKTALIMNRMFQSTDSLQHKFYRNNSVSSLVQQQRSSSPMWTNQQQSSAGRRRMLRISPMGYR